MISGFTIILWAFGTHKDH